MTQAGTFYEGLIFIVLAIAVAVLSNMLKIPWLMTIAPVLFALGLGYAGGGAAGKAQMMSQLKKLGLSDRFMKSGWLK